MAQSIYPKSIRDSIFTGVMAASFYGFIHALAELLAISIPPEEAKWAEPASVAFLTFFTMILMLCEWIKTNRKASKEA